MQQYGVRQIFGLELTATMKPKKKSGYLLLSRFRILGEFTLDVAQTLLC
jgi:hypothetical protein